MNAAATALADYMSELSEKAYCAGWMMDLEAVLWQSVLEGPFHYGRLELTSAHVDRLHALSEACGGWIIYRDRMEFVSLSEWLVLYARQRED